jgi:hypothetical protein
VKNKIIISPYVKQKAALSFSILNVATPNPINKTILKAEPNPHVLAAKANKINKKAKSIKTSNHDYLTFD